MHPRWPRSLRMQLQGATLVMQQWLRQRRCATTRDRHPAFLMRAHRSVLPLLQLAGALRTLISSTETQASAAAAGAIPAAVSALEAATRLGAPAAAEAAGGLLRNLAARHPSNRSAIGAAGGLRALTAALLALLATTDPASLPPAGASRSSSISLAAEQLCGALWNAVAEAPANAAAAVELGAAEALRRAHSGFVGIPAVSIAAASALAALGAPLLLGTPDFSASRLSAPARPPLELPDAPMAATASAPLPHARSKRTPPHVTVRGAAADAVSPLSGEPSPVASESRGSGSVSVAASRPPPARSIGGGSVGGAGPAAPKRVMRRAQTGLPTVQQSGRGSSGGAAAGVQQASDAGRQRSARGSSASSNKR